MASPSGTTGGAAGAAMKPDPQVQTAIRLPESLLARLDKLAMRLSRPGAPATRSSMLRLATEYGVERIEMETKKR
jgi:predicted DNA-binding protein